MSDASQQSRATAIDIFTVPLEHETDTTVMSQLISDGVIDPAQTVAVTGKVEGNTPGENSRGNAMAAVRWLLTDAARLPEEHVGQIPFVLSGGGVGILTPHLAVYTRRPWDGPLGEPRLTLGTALSDPILPEWVVKRQIVEQVAGAYSVFMQDTIMYISNSAFHQGPEGGGTVAAIVWADS